MVSAHHILWTAYGWWLPNDSRGSTSRVVRAAAIAGLGELHYGRKKTLPAYGHTRKLYDNARGVLQHDLLTFSAAEVAVIASAFESVIRDRPYTCYACAIMPDHVHLVIRKHRDKAEEMIARLQEESRRTILASSPARRSAEHPVWGGPGWKVFLDTREDIERTCEYVRQNPIKIRQREQRWPFVTQYDGWLAGVGAVPANSQASFDRRGSKDA